jgi:hypothetical protein
MNNEKKETIHLSAGKSEQSDEVEIGLLPPTVSRGQTHATWGEKKVMINLPPPYWTPTGNSGEWKWEQNVKGEMRWRWDDDVYGYDSPPAGCSLRNGMKHDKEANGSWWERSFKWLTTISE